MKVLESFRELNLPLKDLLSNFPVSRKKNESITVFFCLVADLSVDVSVTR